MPHMHIDAFEAPASFPITENGVTFNYIADNVQHHEKLIATHCDDKHFFLLLKEQPDKTLLKSDKISRPSPTHYVKKALNAYRDATGMRVLSSNVDDASINLHLKNDDSLRTIRDFAENFPVDREVRIEVGFGSGRHLLLQAEQRPDVLFIGLEIHKPSIEQVLKQINIRGLSNLLLVDYDARLFLELVPSNTVGRIYVHFPIPWDKKPHRRVINESFVSESIRTLMPDGKLELRTDSDNYFDYSVQTFMALRQNHLEIRKNRNIEISSKYEDRWRRMEKNIYDVIMHNEEVSDPLSIDGDFTFHAVFQANEQKLEVLNGSTHRFENGFIHFERLYRINDGRFMFRLSVGPYERPEHLYLLLGDIPSYFPEAPVRTRINLEAHRRLSELIYG